MKKIFLGVFLVLAFFSAFASDPIVEDRIQKLEDYNKEVAQQRWENLEAKLEGRLSNLEGKIENQLKENQIIINEQLSTFKIIGWVVGALLTIGVLGFIYQLTWGFKKLAEKTLKDKLKSHLFENAQSLMELVNSQKEASKVKREKLIRVVSGSDEETNMMKNQLERMGFQKFECTTISSPIPFPNSDLLIFCNIKNNLQIPTIVSYMEQSEEDEVFIYYGGRLMLPEGKPGLSAKLNYANSKFTLYHHIVNTLVFKDILKEHPGVA